MSAALLLGLYFVMPELALKYHSTASPISRSEESSENVLGYY
ncbi:uncharacterized protein RSE6_09658 [Rhynchosporium secalis]|uniref:Uncharacterized protein n=1 Tax=Rhynchosporium secalis TaxID=38038 RepID=A0A1E1MIH7_RHYSE|nr:uncharacterized protein RSE6_09658 [Rhynchosporium secalis]